MSGLRSCLPPAGILSRIQGLGLWAVALLLLANAPRPGDTFALCRGATLGLGKGSFGGVGRVHRLLASNGASTLALRRSRGRGLYMDGSSCAPETTDEKFEAEVLSLDRPVLVFFRAPWCGPCRMVGPVVDEFIDEHGEKLKVLEICTDENLKTAAEFKITNIPTLMLFSGGKSIMTVVGAVPLSSLVSSIKKHIDL